MNKTNDNIFLRLREYYLKVAEVLRGEAKAASVFRNCTDIGTSREKIYAEFLKQHIPSKCNIFFGGFIFDEEGVESKQLDIIITTDTTPRFNLHNQDGSGKSFSPIEGTLGVVSIKSTLDKKELFDALDGIASIPPVKDLKGRISSQLKYGKYDNWPVKIIYATDSIAPDTIFNHVNEYYLINHSIPINRRPDFIHIAGKCFIYRVIDGMIFQNSESGAVEDLTVGSFSFSIRQPDLQAIAWTIDRIQENTMMSNHILFSYDSMVSKMLGISLWE
ncbi:MAG: DUF6602 domain-containing protein [Patescibacteria group bacterium]